MIEKILKKLDKYFENFTTFLNKKDLEDLGKIHAFDTDV